MRRLYCSYSLHKDNAPFKFIVREIPIKRICEDNTIETKRPIFYGGLNFTNYINGNSKIKTETEYIEGESSVYFSESLEKCVEHLASKKEKLFEKYELILNEANLLHRKLLESGIEKEISEDCKNGRKKYSLWMEGYSVTGNRSRTQYLGEFEDDSFTDACDNFGKEQEDPGLYVPGKGNGTMPRYWGCRIFDNELDARKSFG